MAESGVTRGFPGRHAGQHQVTLVISPSGYSVWFLAGLICTKFVPFYFIFILFNVSSIFMGFKCGWVNVIYILFYFGHRLILQVLMVKV